MKSKPIWSFNKCNVFSCCFSGTNKKRNHLNQRVKQPDYKVAYVQLVGTHTHTHKEPCTLLRSGYCLSAHSLLPRAHWDPRPHHTHTRSIKDNTRAHTCNCYSLFSWKEPLVHRQACTNQTDLPCISLLCGSRSLAAPLRKQHSGFFQGLRVKGLLWLHARLMTGNIELWLSSGIYHLTLLNVPVCSSVDGMWEIMCTTHCVTASLIQGDFVLKHTLSGFLKLIDQFI